MRGEIIMEFKNSTQSIIKLNKRIVEEISDFSELISETSDAEKSGAINAKLQEFRATYQNFLLDKEQDFRQTSKFLNEIISTTEQMRVGAKKEENFWTKTFPQFAPSSPYAATPFNKSTFSSRLSNETGSKDRSI